MRNLKPIKQYSVFLIQALEDTIQELSYFYRVFLCLSLGLMSLVTFFIVVVVIIIIVKNADKTVWQTDFFFFV